MRRTLTHEEAVHRGRVLAVETYTVAVDLRDATSGWFPVRSTIHFGCTDPGAPVLLDMIGAHSVSATLNGETIDSVHYEPDAGLHLPELADWNVLTVEALFPVSSDGHGLTCRRSDDGHVYAYTHLQPDHARRVFPCFDQPDLKASLTLDVTVPAEWVVLGNPRTTASTPTGQPGSENDEGGTSPGGARTVRLGPTRPVATYLVAVAAGPFAKVSAGDDQSTSSLWCREGLAGHLDGPALARDLAEAQQFYESAFELPCPFQPLNLVFVPDFAAGAMENAGCIFASEDFVFRSEVSAAARARRREMVFHETAHQWFGNLVTPSWWDDLWLNEAFATWASIHAVEQLSGSNDARVTFTATKKATAYELDTKPSHHPVVTEVADVAAGTANFDMLTYAKGAAMIDELAQTVGAARFLTAVAAFLAGHADSTARCADLLSAVAAAASAGDADLVERWAQRLRTPGVPVMRWRRPPPATGIDDQTPTQLTMARAATDEEDQAAGEMATAVFDLSSATTAGTTADETVTEPSVVFHRLPHARPPRSGHAAVPNYDGRAYVRCELDATTVQTLRGSFDRLGDPMARAVVWSDLWHMVRQHELDPHSYLEITALGLRVEQNSALLQRAIARAGIVVGRHLAAGSARELGWRWWTELLMGWSLDGAHHERALLTARALLDSPLEESHLEQVRTWWAGERVGPRPVDDDLRWRLARALVAHGRFRADDIEDAFPLPHQDGVRARLAASAPTRDAKCSAWATVVEDDDVPPARRHHAAMGIVHPAHGQVLAALTDRYFEEIPDVWLRRGDGGTRAGARQLFPHWAQAEETVQRAQSAAADPDLPRALGLLWRDAAADLEAGLLSQRHYPATPNVLARYSG